MCGGGPGDALKLRGRCAGSDGLAVTMFTDADKLHLFTRAELQERLGESCTVEWFVRAFQIPARCNGRLFAGGDIVRALASPPAVPSDDNIIGDVAGESAQAMAPRRVTGRRRATDPGTCASIELLPIRKSEQ